MASFLIIGNKDVCLNSSSKELRAIASYKPVYSNVDTTLFESPIEEKLYYALLKRNIKTIPQKPVRGYRLDLAYVEVRQFGAYPMFFTVVPNSITL